MKVACLLIDHFPLRQELRRHPNLKGKPVIISHSTGSGRVVLDCSPLLKGVYTGMPLQEALSMVRSSSLLEADLPFYHIAFGRILHALEQKSPIVEPFDLGCAYVGLDGLEEMYGGEARLIASLLALPSEGDGARIGVAQGKFPAHVAACMIASGGAMKVPEDVRSFLSKCPVEILPVAWELKARLHSFGLNTLGQVSSLSPRPLQAQFGPEGLRIWRLSSGIDDAPLFPRRREETVHETLSFLDPTVSLEAVLVAVENLLGRAFARPPMRGRCARVVAIEGRILNGTNWLRRLVFKEPVGNKQRAFHLVRNSLCLLALPGPLEDLQLTLSGLTGEAGRQENLFPEVRRWEQLRETMRQLEARLGQRPPVYMVRDLEPWSRIPERRQVLVPFEP